MASRSGSDCVKVALRVRPLIGIETAKGDNECVVSYPQQESIPQIQIGGSKCFTFDYLFSDTSAQKEVYVDCIKPLVTSFLEGYNATVIAYGQTGSGKTYTMGTLGCDDSKLQEEWGVIPSAIHDIFNTLSQKRTGSNNNDYKVQCSFIEIYNEVIKDLLDPHSSKTLAIRENVNASSKIHIPNMKLELVENAMDCREALDRGGASRATAYTQMNAQSSRSHAIFTIHLHHIKQQNEKQDTENEKKAEPVVIQSKFHFVDLAGSERAKKTGASGTRLAEGISINAGLLALGNVIAALGDPRLKSKHVPFRDSKITRLLQDSLGGNSRTLMIACISPARSNMLETKNTLNYANRAKNIKNKAVVNRDPRSRQILELRQRVKELERQLKSGGNNNNNNKATNNNNNGNNNNMIHMDNNEYEHQIEQISQLQTDLNDANNEVLKLQEKVKSLRLNLSELQDKYYNQIGSTKTDLMMEKRKRMQLLDEIKAKYPDFEAQGTQLSQTDETEMRQQIETLERLKLENETFKKENERLQKTILSTEARDQHFVHNLHDQMSKLVRGDFSVMNENLISPTKRFDVSSSTESIPELRDISENLKQNKDVILLVDDYEEDDDEEDDDDEEEDDEDHEEHTDANDDDNDVSMKDPDKEQLKKENKEKVKETSTERAALRLEREKSITYKKKLLKEQKCHDKQMEFIAHEQISRERSQRLKSEKYNREIDRTSRDINNLQTILKQLCQQRQSDVGKQAFYEKQVANLSQELSETHKQGKLFEAEKSKLNANDIKKLQAQEMKISNYQNKVKSLELQIRSYRDKLGQIRKLQTMHKEDMLKMSQMTHKLSSLKKKKVNLQRKIKDENKTYSRWKQQTERTIKQLRKIQREKNIQLQRHKSQLTKTTSALKQKTAALVHLKRRQREIMMLNRRKSTRSRKGSRSRNKGSAKQIKSKIAKLLSALIIKHQLFNKYKLFDREYKSLLHDLKESECGLNDVNMILNQLQNNNINMEDECDEETQRLNTERLEFEQRIEDTQSTIKYIREQMILMSHKMKEHDHKRWKQLQNAQKVSLSCTETDLDKFINVANIPYARQCINFLINQHLRFRLIIDDYKKQTKHLKAERNKILANADNEMRKKMVLIEKLQNNLNEERAKYRIEQRKELNHENDDESDDDCFDESEDDEEDKIIPMHIDNDTDNDCDDDDLDLNHNNNNNKAAQDIIPFETDLESDLKRKQDELDKSRMLLNMFCSPVPNRTQSHQIHSESFLSENNNNNSSRLNTSLRNIQQSEKKLEVKDMMQLPHTKISVQLTPFHTPIVKSRTKSLRSHDSSAEYHSFLTNANSHNNNNSSTNQHNNDHNNNSININNNSVQFNINSHRSSPGSPLFTSAAQVQITAHDDDINELHSIVENNGNQNVFSRLTNPKHFIGTSRTRAQELEALKQKVRKQNVSHRQIVQKRTYLQQKNKTAATTAANAHYTHYHQQQHHNHHEDELHHIIHDSDYNNIENSSVFDRLHTTSIRNKRCLDDSLLHEASRVNVSNNNCNLTNEMISKKAQRNLNNSASKSMLMNPVRVLTPDS